jgi:uncharacterized protein YbjT (DUF2867 family)
MTILVTGATGTVGTQVVAQLTARGAVRGGADDRDPGDDPAPSLLHAERREAEGRDFGP